MLSNIVNNGGVLIWQRNVKRLRRGSSLNAC